MRHIVLPCIPIKCGVDDCRDSPLGIKTLDLAIAPKQHVLQLLVENRALIYLDRKASSTRNVGSSRQGGGDAVHVVCRKSRRG